MHEIQASRAWLTEQGEASKEALQQRLTQYLSQEHVRNTGKGCVLPALSTEVARAEAETQQAYAQELRKLVKDIERIFDKNHVSWPAIAMRSEEHTSELQSRGHLVCRLLLEKKKH